MTHLLLLGSLKVGGRRKGRKFPGTDERRISTEGRDWSRKEKERKKVTRRLCPELHMRKEEISRRKSDLAARSQKG